MLRSSITGLDCNKLRLWLAVFFLALAIPTGVLLRQTYSQLKWEAFHQHRVLAEELAGRIDSRISQLISREESRSFTDYTFLVLSGDPAARFLQRSPLSHFPVANEIPGLIGYFQVDSEGKFSSPLLPESGISAATYGISSQQLQQRRASVTQVQNILSENRLVQVDKVDSAMREDKADTEPSRQRDMEMDRTASFGGRAAAPSSVASIAAPAEEQLAGQAVFDELNKAAPLQQKGKKRQAPGKLGRVEDLKLDDRYELARDALQERLTQSSEATSREKRSARKEYNVLPEAELAPSGADKPRILTFESDIDPFEFSLLDSGHFVLFRKVWRDGQRIIQGMVVEQQPLLSGLVEAAFRETTLSRMSDLIVAYRGDVFAAFSGQTLHNYVSGTEQLSGALLHQTRLSAPLGDLELIFSITRLPTAPGATLVNWLAAILALVLCAGFYLMYRLGIRQIQVARQQQDFVSAVSHELKTPLTSIRMYGEMLREGWAPEEKKNSYYDYIHDESERLSRLIANVLQLARMTRNELDVATKPVAVAELMDSIQSKVTSQIESVGFTLSISIDPAVEDTRIEVDSDYFMQILINLVDNAIKFSARSGRKTIDISCRRLPNSRVQFAVRDFGPGVARDQMKKIFQLFYRSENELTRETVGTGIGLALVHQLTLAMDGKVDVVNRDPGAEFRVVFPLLKSD